MDFLREARELLKYESIFSLKELLDAGYEEEGYIASPDVLYIIFAEYEADDDDCVLHYHNIHTGSVEFNELLEKYDLYFEWYSPTIAQIYKQE